MPYPDKSVTPHRIFILGFCRNAAAAVIHINDGIVIRIEGGNLHPGYQLPIGGLGTFVIIFDLVRQCGCFGGIFEDDVIAVNIIDAAVGVCAVSEPGARFLYHDGKIGLIHGIVAVADDLAVIDSDGPLVSIGTGGAIIDG